MNLFNIYNLQKYRTDSKLANFTIFREETAHFTQVVVDGNNKVGCMCLKYEDSPRYFTNWACDFGRGTFVYFPVYDQITAGQTPGQGCTTGTDTTYTALCSDAEPKDLNAMDWSKFDWDSYHAHSG